MSTKGKKLTRILEAELGPMTFASFVRGARASKDLTQAEMARVLGVARSTLCDIESGRHLVSPALASSIAKTCGFSEEMAVLAALQDQLNKANLKMQLSLVS